MPSSIVFVLSLSTRCLFSKPERVMVVDSFNPAERRSPDHRASTFLDPGSLQPHGISPPPRNPLTVFELTDNASFTARTIPGKRPAIAEIAIS